MVIQIEAVYERGVFRPLEPLDLSEGQRVRLTFENGKPGPQLSHEFES